MIRRLFYMALGAYIAVWTMRKLQALKPDHVARRTADRALDLAAEARSFAGEVRRLSAGRETELRARFGLDSVETTHPDDVKDGR
ncbi:hypothetical protein Sme01_48290 [Sphaerisporangium melleum]|uniref:Secreted protein n=1 Tax=Sphaerisporangium melleum TaxID=321316 RepID=A0A917R3U1_9ACTN|nr:hypothetical protein [Sphaerisporangium melleum]GGK87071.1 hypothetical protein GCM10007964_31960 [Sphaerisporangium melleum]GII72353.1 hypothetical protein Sme01_48290 [Sphaerisporangium melleum]